MATTFVIPGLEYPEMVTQVQRGMQVLDSHRPGWQDAVDLDDLDIGSGMYCILGQVYRDEYSSGFVGAAYHLFGVVWVRNVPDEEYRLLADHGFAVSLDYCQQFGEAASQLEMVWKVLLVERAITTRV